MIKFTLIAAALTISIAFGQIEIYNEDFQSGLPVNYTVVDNDGLTPNAVVSEYTEAWIEITDPENASDTIMASTSYFDPVGQADRWLITPAITLGAYGNIAYWEAKSEDDSFPEDYYVLVSSTDTQISSFTDTLVFIFNELPDWTTQSGNLSDLGLDNQTIHLAFVNRTDDGFKLYIDDIRVEMEDPSGVDELSEVQITVFPNPTTKMIEISGLNPDEVTIYSLAGKQLLTTSSSKIDLSSLAAGRYILEARNSKHVARSLVVKD